MRYLHTMLRVGNLDRSIDFYTGVLGMRVLRRKEYPDGRFTNAILLPAGRTSLQMTLASEGRSASALTGSLSGSGSLTLESARIAGLDSRAFDAALLALARGD